MSGSRACEEPWADEMHAGVSAVTSATGWWSGHRREWATVAAVFGALVVVAGAWLAVDRRPPEWDHGNHLERAVLCARDLPRGDLASVLERSSFYPPLVLCGAAVAYLLVPTDVAGHQAIVLGFLGLGMAATYLLGRRFAGGPGGVVAAVLFGTAPFVVTQALRFQLDLPLAAMVALALEMLLRADGFARRGWSLAAGAALGLGMLTKPPFLVYVLPVTILALARVRGRGAVGHAALAGLVALVVSLPWYGPRLLGIAAQIGARSFRQAAEAGHPPPLAAAALAYYPSHFPMQFGALAVALFALGLLVAFRRRLGVLILALAPLLVFLAIQNKNLRYTLPLLPIAAVLGGVGFAALPRALRGPMAIAVALVGAVQVSAAAFGVPPASRLAIGGLPLALESPPLTARWPHRELLELIVRDSERRPVTVSVVPNHAFFSIANFRYYGVRDGLPLTFVRAWGDEPIGVEYMIVKSGDVGPPWTEAKPRRIAARLEEDRHLARVFPVIGTWSLPDGSEATLRARRAPTDLRVPPARLASAIEAGLRRRLPELVRDVEGLGIRLVYDRGILGGEVTRAEITAATATVGEFRRRRAALRVHDLRIVLEGLVVNPLSALEAGRFDPLDLRRFRLERATIRAADLQTFLRDVRGFRRAAVRLGDGVLLFETHRPGPDVEARVRVLDAADRPFAFAAEHVAVAGVRVPGVLVNWVLRHYDPSAKIASRLPMPVDLGRIRVTPDAILIAPDPP